MKLTANISAPYFTRTDIFGREIDLNNYRGKKILLAFFRHAGCPFCNLRVHVLTKIHEEMKVKGMEMIFVFESKEKVLQNSIFHKEVSPIPLISDSDKLLYGMYGLEQSALKSTLSHLSSFVQTTFKASRLDIPIHMMKEGESFNTMPAEFLIDNNLIIRDMHYSERLNDRVSVEKIKAFAEL